MTNKRYRYSMFVLSALVFVGLGCNQGRGVNAEARSVVGYWSSDVVVMVADGVFPSKLSGWQFAEVGDDSKTRMRVVRLASPTNARIALEGWRGGDNVRFVLCPLSLVDGSKVDESLFQDLSRVAALRARDSNEKFLFAIAPLDQCKALRSKFMEMGWQDDTEGFANMLIEQMEEFCNFFNSTKE